MAYLYESNAVISFRIGFIGEVCLNTSHVTIIFLVYSLGSQNNIPTDHYVDSQLKDRIVFVGFLKQKLLNHH